MKIVVVFVLLLATEHSVLGKIFYTTYAAYVPKYIRPGLDYSVDVEIFSYNGSVKVEAILMSPDHESSTSALAFAGDVVTLALGKLSFTYQGATDFSVTIVGKDSKTGKLIFQDSTTNIRFPTKFWSIFILTDKAIYVPGQTIKFRAVVTTESLLPYQGTVSYKLQDPDGNVILWEDNAKLTQGVVKSYLKLGRHSTKGKWKITCKVFDQEKYQTVLVEEYAPPKFAVEIKAEQNFIQFKTKGVIGKISAFKYGVPVQGQARVEFKFDCWACKTVVMEFPEFNGTAQFGIISTKFKPDYKLQNLVNFNISASVIDKTAGESVHGSKYFSMDEGNLKMEILEAPKYFKPGLPYVAHLRLGQKDGTFLSTADLANLKVKIIIKYYHKDHRPRHSGLGRKKVRVGRLPVIVGADGIITVKTIPIGNHFGRIQFLVNIPTYSIGLGAWDTLKFKSHSNIYLQIWTDDVLLSVGDKAKLTVRVTQKRNKNIYQNSTNSSSLEAANPRPDAFRVLHMAGGKILKSEIYKPTLHDNHDSYWSFNYSFIVKTEYSPVVHVVISFVGESGELVCDAMKINVQAVSKHEVTMSTSTNFAEVGQNVSITVKADAGSFVGIQATSPAGNDILQIKNFRDFKKFEPLKTGNKFLAKDEWWRISSSVDALDISDIFENSGIIVLPGGIVFKGRPYHFCYVNYYIEDCYFDMYLYGDYYYNESNESIDYINSFDPRDQWDYGDTKDANSGELFEVKSYFGESWIWTDDAAGDDGSVTFNFKAPNSFTTWEINSFAVSSSKGLATAKNASKVTVSRNFFISLNLPASIVVGESLAMKLEMFNLFDVEIAANLTLIENEWYDLVIPSGASDAVAAGPTRTVVIKNKDLKTVIFPIKFKKAGIAIVEVQARSPYAADAVEKTLKVKSDGIPKVVSHSTFINRQDNLKLKSQVTFDIDIPDNAVEGSVHVTLLVSGNIFGSALSNFGNLLNLPVGCVEQTLLNFASGVYVSLYFKKVEKWEGAIKQKSLDLIREEYTNELRYKKWDGSFNPFGQTSYYSGSTWLTAFAVKCFNAANELNPNLVEESVIEEAIKFILRQQYKDGNFSEPGHIIYKDIQNGLNSNERITAYTLIALTEGKNTIKNANLDLWQNVANAVAKAQNYLEGRIEQLKDIYTLSIVGYALSLAESAETAKVLRIIDEQAISEGTVKYWRNEKNVVKCKSVENPCPLEADRPGASSVETTAYVLLTYAKTGRVDQVMPIVKWLVEQRGSLGGYHSTQDTVMAIQALSTIAGLIFYRPTDLDMNVSHSGMSDFSANIQLNDETAIALQEIKLPSLAGTVTVSATGFGIGDVQVTVEYNLPKRQRSDQPFVMEVKLNNTISDQPTLKVCSQINENHTAVINDTGMYVISFTLPSGYTIDDKQATEDNKQTKLIELVGDEVTGYFNELPRRKKICMSLQLNKYADVAGIKPRIVKGYEYNKPTLKAQQFIFMESEDDICKICGEKCVGCPPVSNPRGPLPQPTPLEPQRCCGQDTLPCPNFSDGLYYDSGSHIIKMINESDISPICKAPNGAGDSSSYWGLPGSLLNGVNQYIECSGVSRLKRMLISKRGFTISLLIFPSNQVKRKKHTIFSIGSKDAKKSYVVFAKMPRSSKFSLKVFLNGYLLIMRNIRNLDIEQNIWSLVTVTVKDKSARIFVDGGEKGSWDTKRYKADNITGDITINIGRSHSGRNDSRGDFKGLVSSLDIWLRALSKKEIEKHASCYHEAMLFKDPKLSVNQVHRIIPKAIRHCFVTSYYASDLKRRAGELTTVCDQPNGQKST